MPGGRLPELHFVSFTVNDPGKPSVLGEEFENEVLHRLGSGVAMPNVAFEITPETGGYALRMNVGGEARELHDVDCRELFRAAVVVTVALTLSRGPPRPRESHEKPIATDEAKPAVADALGVPALVRYRLNRSGKPGSAEQPTEWRAMA